MTEAVYKIKVGDMEIDVVKKDIKHLHLAVYPPTGRIRIASPLRIDDEAIRLFALSKMSWIKKNQARLVAQPRQSPRQYLDRETHYFQGRAYLLKVIARKGAAEVTLANHSELILYIREGASLAQKEKAMLAWYRKALKLQIPDLIEKWEAKLGVQLDDWGIKKMKTKWGTCNIEARRIWLNLELAKHSVRCLEYVILHEMVHLLERHHNKNFRFYMDKYLPDWRAVRAELNAGIISAL